MVKHFRLDYETSMQEPNITQLQPVIDNSDPLNLSTGNPTLKPGYAHSFRLNYTQFDPASSIGFFAFVNSTYTTNAIASSQTVNPQTLVRLTVPVNVAVNLRISGNFSFGFPIKQIRELVALVGAPEQDCTVARDVAEARLIEVGQRLKELRALERSLRRFVEDCSAQCAGGPARECIILEDLKTSQPSCCEAPKASVFKSGL